MDISSLSVKDHREPENAYRQQMLLHTTIMIAECPPNARLEHDIYNSSVGHPCLHKLWTSRAVFVCDFFPRVLNLGIGFIKYNAQTLRLAAEA